MSESEKNSNHEESEKAGQPSEVTRRDFFNEIAVGALGIAGLGAATVTYRYLSPNVLFEPPTTFRAGAPDDYPVNSITFLQDQQVYIVHAADGFYAVSAICTHLGCITQWKPDDNLIECPCHGSKFKRDGIKVAGPAPRPLPHFSITLGTDGSLVVDTLEVVEQTKVLKV
ncbi:MAG TPA: ubiquinol-cytochrome c reductase iron-sulfur subunit [Terriglobia bacterium]|nr:ubiquinol-cytochrome c reductase iron-sulfur subunit [Terriglobia bacterium]